DHDFVADRIPAHARVALQQMLGLGIVGFTEHILHKNMPSSCGRDQPKKGREEKRHRPELWRAILFYHWGRAARTIDSKIWEDGSCYLTRGIRKSRHGYFFLKTSTAFQAASGGCSSYSSARSRYILARASSG